jgi:hypothetical protein
VRERKREREKERKREREKERKREREKERKRENQQSLIKVRSICVSDQEKKMSCVGFVFLCVSKQI